MLANALDELLRVSIRLMAAGIEAVKAAVAVAIPVIANLPVAPLVPHDIIFPLKFWTLCPAAETLAPMLDNDPPILDNDPLIELPAPLAFAVVLSISLFADELST